MSRFCQAAQLGPGEACVATIVSYPDFIEINANTVCDAMPDIAISIETIDFYKQLKSVRNLFWFFNFKESATGRNIAHNTCDAVSLFSDDERMDQRPAAAKLTSFSMGVWHDNILSCRSWPVQALVRSVSWKPMLTICRRLI